MEALAIHLRIVRSGVIAFAGETSTANMKRQLEDLVAYLFRELDFPAGVLLMTGTGVVPPDDFTLQTGDTIRIEIGDLVLDNYVA
jgi:2-dehydro-3-deoxy-D-arabinonate dehydratase